MGVYFLDKYSILHFLSGIFLYYVGLSFWFILIGHFFVEWIENTPSGIYFITKYLTWWPGGKRTPDTYINSIGDIFVALIGHIIAHVYNENNFDLKKLF